MALSVLTRPANTKANENQLGIYGGGNIGGSRIDDRIAILSNFTKKMSFGEGFLIPKASLAFI